MDRSLQGYAIGLKAVNAALHAVQIAELLHENLQYHEAYFSTIDVLVFAATALLVVEIGSTDDALVLEAMRAGRAARELLLVLSLQSTTASRCWEAFSEVPSSASGTRYSGGLLGNNSTSPDMQGGGRWRTKAPGPIKLPPRPATLRQEDSAIDIRSMDHVTTECLSPQYTNGAGTQPLSLDPSLQMGAQTIM